jgi:hypothetical protein
LLASRREAGGGEGIHGGALFGLPASSVCYLIVEEWDKESRSGGGDVEFDCKISGVLQQRQIHIISCAFRCGLEMWLLPFPLGMMRAVRHLRT